MNKGHVWLLYRTMDGDHLHCDQLIGVFDTSKHAHALARMDRAKWDAEHGRELLAHLDVATVVYRVVQEEVRTLEDEWEEKTLEPFLPFRDSGTMSA